MTIDTRYPKAEITMTEQERDMWDLYILLQQRKGNTIFQSYGSNDKRA